ncbi:MAG TPA: VWA domain-containing protein, partial [Planctomycetota bacterium]|nr:VWA domain-containing protein [Planctomycetota bacterium]
MSEFKNLLNPGAPRPPRWRWLERPWKMAAGVLVGLLALYVVIATVRFLAWGEEDAFIEWFNELASQPLGSFQFASPRWLLWLVPAWVACLVITHYSVAGLRIWPRRFVLMVRLVVVTLAILILAELQWVTFTDNLSVVFVIDHSRSVPEALQTKALEYVNQAVKTKEADDRAGLVYFGGQAYPMTSLNNLFSVDSRVKPDIKDDSTNIARALQTAQSMFPRGARRRIVLFTDGRETVGDVLEQVKRMHHENIRIDVVPLIHPMQGEVIAEKLDMPSVVNSDQPFDARLYVNNVNGKPVDVNIMLQLKTSEGNAVPVFRAPIRYTLAPGMNAIPIPDLKNKEPSFYRYEAIIKAVRPEDDTIVENNTVYGSTQIKGESKVLILVGRAYDGANWRSQDVKPLDDALKAEGIFTDVRYAGMDVGDKLPKTLEDLQNFDCFILMNISKEDLSDAMVPMKTCVNDLGCGLIMLGGRDSFGAGGYLHTPIEEILPVSCETEDKQVMMNGALVVVLHTCEFEQGNMWAVKIAKVCVDTLSVGDWYGVMEYAWSAGSNWVVPLARITSKAGLKQQIDKANPGDMPDFNSVVADADAALSKIPAKVGAKRIVIISDGDPSPPMPTTMQNLKDHGISMSFVGIQPHGGNEISNMQALSKMTGGNYYFCLDVDHLPRIFQHEAAIVRQQLVVENPD